jgi:DNA-binding CsgD family transcriptional regulator/outer membrane lipoprotein-sorting protein
MSDSRPGLADLTPRQREVLDLMARGLTNAKIAERLDISLAGAKWHVSEVLSRLGASSREEAAEYFRQERRISKRLASFVVQVPLRWIGLGVAAITAATASILIASLVLTSPTAESDGDRLVSTARASAAAHVAGRSFALQSVVPILSWSSSDLQTARALPGPVADGAFTDLSFLDSEHKRVETVVRRDQVTIGSATAVWDGAHVWIYSDTLESVRTYGLPLKGSAGSSSATSNAANQGTLNAVLNQIPACYQSSHVERQDVFLGRSTNVINLGRSRCPATIGGDPRGYDGRGVRVIWLDTQSGFVLRDELHDDTGGVIAGTTSEVIDIDFQPAFSADMFTFSIPQGLSVEDCDTSPCP